MTAGSLAALTAIYFVTSVVTVVTGSTTLITVPVMLQFGLEPRIAVATNMLALAMLSFGGLLPFVKTGSDGTTVIDQRRAPSLAALTAAGSVIGAMLLFAVPSRWMTLIIPVAMIVVTLVMLRQPHPDKPPRPIAGYTVLTLLAIYGGFLSGGYATLVTGTGVLFFRYGLLRAIAMSRLLNTVSSLIAVAIFAWRGIIDWRLGIALSVAGFLGGLLGSHWVQKMPSLLLRRLFLMAVAALALKVLIFDTKF